MLMDQQKRCEKHVIPLQKKKLPKQLKNGIESLSGMNMDHVQVHYNSPKPKQLNAHAYAQGSEIHLASGQEKHLPHEAWHVVQQAQGRVRPSREENGLPVNEDHGLEREADVMGNKALHHNQ
ncbi:eCIS core domain-containing protein [Endozoicomonadaceae bacterium StTr2]